MGRRCLGPSGEAHAPIVDDPPIAVRQVADEPSGAGHTVHGLFPSALLGDVVSSAIVLACSMISSDNQ